MVKNFSHKGLLPVLILGVVFSLAVSYSWAQSPLVPPTLQGSVQWNPIPGVPGVQYAPNHSTDLFRYGKDYYNYSQGNWYQGKSQQGSWKKIKNPPPIFQQIDPTYFKSPPGWSKGKKKGWGGAPMPPGQMKKLYQ